MARVVQGAAALAAVAEAGSLAPDYAGLWVEFKNKYGKQYDGPGAEQSRYDTFKKKIDFIYETNAKNLSYTLGVNSFADLTHEEFKGQYVGPIKPADSSVLKSMGTHVYSGEKLADDVDWVANGAVTPVKNQAQCGSCWSFSSTGALEGARKVAGLDLVSLSEQELVSCDTQQDHGCHGGNPYVAMSWVKDNGLCSEDNVPYQCADQNSAQCQNAQCALSSCTAVLQPGDVTQVMQVDPTQAALESAVSGQPVSVAIEADKPAFQMYNGGILGDAACGEQIDHAVLAVGYGTEGGKMYWKVKNSWGPTWGESGYIRLARGAAEEGGECGIRKMAAYPTVKSSGPSPGPSPTPPPPSPPSGTSHYGPGPLCQPDEVLDSIQGVPGQWCAPGCANGPCPSDVPAGVTATPSCLWGTRCALMCTGAAGECGQGTCQTSEYDGSICTYPQQSQSDVIV